MDYQKIFKKSFNLSWKHKYLWLLGLLSGGFGPGQIFTYRDPSVNDIKSWQPTYPTNSSGNLVFDNWTKTNAVEPGRVLGETISKSMSDYSFWLIFVLLLLATLLAIYLTTTSGSALIKAAADLNEGKESNLKISWRVGHRLFWRKLSLGLIIFSITLIIIAAIILPTALFSIFDHPALTILSGVLLGFLGIIGIIYVGLVAPYAERILVLERKKTVESIKEAVHFFNKNWKNLTVLALLRFAISLLFMMLLGATGLILVLVALLLGLGLSLISIPLTIIYVVLAVLIALVLIWAIAGIYSSFSSSSLTLAYSELKAKNK